MSEFAQYREITNKLRKRFTLRKPNYREASDSFRRLSNELGHFNDYSGYCMLSAAQCEHNLVASLKEQISSTSSGTTSGVHSGSSSVSSSIPLLPQINSKFSSSSSSSSSSSHHHHNQHQSQVNSLLQSHQFDIKTGFDRLIENATNLEFQTFLDAARLFRGKSKANNKMKDEMEQMSCFALEDQDNINATIAAYADAIRCCPPKMVTVVHCELAGFYKSLQRYHEAGEIYFKVGLFREAADCLLSGHHFELAYQCYLELFRQCEGQTSHVSHHHQQQVTTPKSGHHHHHHVVHHSQHELPHPSTTNKQIKTTEITSTPSGESNAQSSCPFMFDHYLTIDDYITIFLLRLYLYDPVKYEYASPIIPFPDEVFPANSNYLDFNRNSEIEIEQPRRSSSALASTLSNEDRNYQFETNNSGQKGIDVQIDDQCHDEELSSSSLNTETLTLPFVDFISGKIDRTSEDLIELNMLLETLYLSYRNEFKQTVDNEIGLEPEPEVENGVEDDNGDEDSSSSTYSDAVENAEKIEIPEEDEDGTKLKSPDSVDGNSTGNDTLMNDDFSSRLQQLTLKYCGSSQFSDDDGGDVCDEDCDCEIKMHSGNNCPILSKESEERYTVKLRQKLTKQFEASLSRKKRKFFLNQDYYLRKEISTKLFPLLNYQQNQLVYQILTDKD